MANIRRPRYGSMQFWPRKRAKSQNARIRAWPDSAATILLGFAGYKVGMTHVMMTDNRKNALTKGETIACPVTIIECPPLKIIGIRIYQDKYYATNPVLDIYSDNLDKQLARRIMLPKQKKQSELLTQAEQKINKASDVRLLVHTQPGLCGFGKKKPEIFELALGGKTTKDKFDFAKEQVGKEIPIDAALKEGQQLDIHAITKGKGFQGPVKRFGVPLRSHKAEKTKRGPGSLGAWCAQAHIMYRVAHAGQMGYHQRTEYNKWLLKISKTPSEINPKSGFKRYGTIKNPYLLLKGSVAGPAKRLIKFVPATRKNPKTPEEAPTIEQICVSNIS